MGIAKPSRYQHSSCVMQPISPGRTSPTISLGEGTEQGTLFPSYLTPGSHLAPVEPQKKP